MTETSLTRIWHGIRAKLDVWLSPGVEVVETNPGRREELTRDRILRIMADSKDLDAGEVLDRRFARLTQQAGLSRLTESLFEVMEETIRIRARMAASDLHVVIGTSKFGGIPDLPPDMGWPRCAGIPLVFLAQLNLREIAPYDSVEFLPTSGMLYFYFHPALNQPDAYRITEKTPRWFVHYYDGDLSALERPPLPEGYESECRYNPCVLDFWTEQTLPPWDVMEDAGIEFADGDQERYLELLRLLGEMNAPAPHHQMLGYPIAIETMRHPDERLDDMLLLQVANDKSACLDNPSGHTWRFVISEEALLNKQFDQVRLVMK